MIFTCLVICIYIIVNKNSVITYLVEAPPTIANAELLEWPKKDKLCFLHDVYGVVDTIKYVFNP